VRGVGAAGLGLRSTRGKGSFATQHAAPHAVPVPLLLLRRTQSRAARCAPTSPSCPAPLPQLHSILVGTVGSAGKIVPFVVCFVTSHVL